MQIFLLRHGNTFAPGEKVVWVGKSLDLPLVPSGMEQARLCAAALSKNVSGISAVYCSTLRRTREYAEVILRELNLGLSLRVDSRLDELDYGRWGGLAKDEVIQKFGAAELEAWESASVWPTHADWGSSEEEVMAEIRSFVDDLVESQGPAGRVLVVSSNGRIRYFLKLAAGEFERRTQDRSFSVKTGHICEMVWEHGTFSVKRWNQSPASALI